MSDKLTLSEELRQQVRGNLKSPAFIRKMEALMMRAAFCLDDLERQLEDVAMELQRWKEIALSKDFAAVAQAERERCANIVKTNWHMFATEQAAESLANTVLAPYKGD
jgi:hypothetical protein